MTDKPSAELVMLDPSAIQVDAETYQFRSKGDAQGVTPKGRYKTDKWDPIIHGDPLLVHQRVDGSFFVADGHHRLDLVKRLNAQGKGPKAVAAMVLREADGYTPEDVRVIAAYKNMSHGNSGVVDAARVFKEAESGNVHMELLPQLQMDKGNLRLSYSMSKFSDETLNKIDAGAVPIGMAANVINQLPDSKRQEAAIQMISDRLQQQFGDLIEYKTRTNVTMHPVMPPSFAQQVMQRRLNQAQLGF